MFSSGLDLEIQNHKVRIREDPDPEGKGAGGDQLINLAREKEEEAIDQDQVHEGGVGTRTMLS